MVGDIRAAAEQLIAADTKWRRVAYETGGLGTVEYAKAYQECLDAKRLFHELVTPETVLQMLRAVDHLGAAALEAEES